MTAQRRRTQYRLFSDQVRRGKFRVSTMLLALEESMRQFADTLVQAGQPDDYASIITHSANILGMHALEHRDEWRTLTASDRKQLLRDIEKVKAFRRAKRR